MISKFYGKILVYIDIVWFYIQHPGNARRNHMITTNHDCLNA